MLSFKLREHLRGLSVTQKQVIRDMCNGKILAFNEGSNISPILLNSDESEFKKLRKDTVNIICNEYVVNILKDYTLTTRKRHFAMVFDTVDIPDILTCLSNK